VSKKEGEDMAANFNIPFFEASAKNHQNIDEAFDQLVREIRRFRKQTTGVAGPGKTGSGLSGGKKKACSLF
jgi:GTPase KRas protein